MAPRTSASPLNNPSSTRVIRRVATELLTSSFIVEIAKTGWSLSIDCTASRIAEVSAAGSTPDFTSKDMVLLGFCRNGTIHFEPRWIRQSV